MPSVDKEMFNRSFIILMETLNSKVLWKRVRQCKKANISFLMFDP